jgi:Putative bacterial sensory transduction regulator
MSMTFADLVGRIAEIGCDFRASREHSEVVVAVPTQKYIDPHDGEKSLLLHVMLQEDGRMVRICVPEVYAINDFAHRGAMAEAMLAVNWRVRVASYVLDESDGEVRVVCDVPVEDGTLTAPQLSRMLTLVAWTVDQFDPVVRCAGTDGTVDFKEIDARVLEDSANESVGDTAGPRRRKSRSKRERRELADLIKAAGGVEGLRKLLEDQGL